MQNYDSLFSQVDSLRDEIIELERSMVQIPTINTGVMPTGNETALCDYVHNWLSLEGITSEIIESAPGRGNLIARVEGDSSDAGLMFMSHLDVVPVEDESKWRFPPFSATISGERTILSNVSRTSWRISPRPINLIPGDENPSV